MQSLKIVLFCIFAAICYGIVYDEITARICVEYFTVGHPNLFGTDSPTLLGIGWSIVATWWVGLILGTGLAFAARFGSRPKRSLADLRRPIFVLLLVMAVCATLAGITGFPLAPVLSLHVPGSWPDNFIVDSTIHIGSYVSGFMGGMTLMVMTWRSRRENASQLELSLTKE